MSTIGTFDYDLNDGKPKASTDLPNSPIIRIHLRTWSLDKDDTPIISAHLMTEGEIDAHIAALKRDLDQVGEKAKSALRTARLTETVTS